MKAKYTSNYIFIDPNNTNQDLFNNKIFLSIKRYHNRWYSKFNILRVKYWSYNDIAELLSVYDNELCDLYLRINPRYAALLSDIGRFIILYNYGGIYHDLKFIPKLKFIDELNYLESQYAIIGEQHPSCPHRVKSGNIISFKEKDDFFKNILDLIKLDLIQAAESNLKGSEAMFAIGSGTYIE